MRGTDPIKSNWEYPNLIFVKLHIAIKYLDYIFFIFSFLLAIIFI